LLLSLSFVALEGCQHASNMDPNNSVPGRSILPQVVQTGGGDLWARFLLPAHVDPGYIVAGPDANMWFTSFGTNTIDQITMAGALAEYPLTGGPGYPLDIVA